MKTEDFVTMGACAAIGTAQTFILREYVDKNYAPLVPQLGQWGMASTVIGIGAGIVATVAGLASMFYNVGLRNPKYQLAALSYGVPAIVSGVAAGYFQPPARIVRLPTPPRTNSAAAASTSAGVRSHPAAAGVYTYQTPGGTVYNAVDPKSNLL